MNSARTIIRRPSLRLAGPLGSSARATWLVSFLGFFLIFAAWATAAPYDGPADEFQHAIRAVGVVSGEIAPDPVEVKDGLGNPGMGAIQHVPVGLFNHAWCWGFDPTVSAACSPELSGGPVEPVPTSAGRYNPAYYALVGWPLKFAPNWTGLVLARMISAALSAALLACAFTILSRWSRSGLMLAGLVAVSTPMLAHLAGAVNPNGLEIAAGIALFAAGTPLILGPPRGSRMPLIALIGVSAIILVTLRSLGPVWLGFAALALFLPLSRPVLRELWRLRAVKCWLIAIAVASGLSLAWILAMGTGNLVPPANGTFNWTTKRATMVYFDSWGMYLKGMVGVAGWFDIDMPEPFYWMWISAAASLVIFALVVSRWADRWRFLAIIIGGVVVPGVLQVSQANTVGFIIGGRYMLPLMVGLPLLGAFIVERDLVTFSQARSITKLFCLILLPTHLVLLVYGMIRWQSGIGGSGLNPFTGQWLPPSGPYLPVILMITGIVTIWLFTLRIQARTEDPVSPATRIPVESATDQPVELPAPIPS